MNEPDSGPDIVIDEEELPAADPRWFDLAPGAQLRIDKWLWHSRFHKSRALATAAVSGGHVQLNGERVKASRNLKVGDRVAVNRGGETVEGNVTGLPLRRGPALLMAAAFTEDPLSRERRQREATFRKLHGGAMPHPDTKPDKRQRRQLQRLQWMDSDD
jgi:ribosome-associated heat shock protein Hsp15